MRQPLDKILRKKLEDTVVKARDIVEVAVNEALQRLGVADNQAPGYLNDEQRALRNALRAHARQLGDKLTDGKQEIERLANEMAYEHWHRMLFARYLEQNNLLMYDEYTPVTLDECFELAEEEPDCKDGWELAGRLAQKMLPQIFRADSPIFAVKLSINHINELENLISAIDPATYQAQDSLGWCYQFWQNKKKKQVNESGVKIGAQELSPVTQLFTEPYMVSFLLDNALGAWWANKCLTQDDYIRASNENELRDKVSIPGVPLEYLRFIKNKEKDHWQPVAGGWEKWPSHLSELKALDPCCGSGHFLVAVFLMLVPMRMQLEGLSAKDAVDAVIRENIHGLELDQRCVELAVFALSLEAWRYPNADGYRILPELQLACSGISIDEAQKEWKDLVKGNKESSEVIAWMRETFKDATLLGSLIEPNKAVKDGQVPPWKILQKIMSNNSDASSEAKSAAEGLAKTAGILGGRYHWIFTNPPYLTLKKQSEKLKEFSEYQYAIAKHDIATVFLIRLMALLEPGSGVQSLVLPQNWTFQNSYKQLREDIVNRFNIQVVVRLGAGAFESISGEVVKAMLLSVSNAQVAHGNYHAMIAEGSKGTKSKSEELQKSKILSVEIDRVRECTDFRILFLSEMEKNNLLMHSAHSMRGVVSGDNDRWCRKFFEISYPGKWSFYQGTPDESLHYTGRNNVIDWSTNGIGMLRPGSKNEAYGNRGVALGQIGSLPATLYQGDLYDNSTGAIVPHSEKELPALWCFACSKEYSSLVREIDQALKVTNATLVKVPFDIDKWSKIAEEKYPTGLPQPYTDDPTQWIYHGHPCGSVVWDENNKNTKVGELRQDGSVLQVALARLLGYKWPAELDDSMELAPEMRQFILKNADFDGLVDEDGIVCIPAVRGEKTAAKRLADILYKSYGDTWSNSVEDNLLKSVKAKDWESWLRDKFFEQHCKLFQHRPFIWHIWDGLKDGFSVLVNYHKLDYKGMERLIYTYLDDWISIQKRNIVDSIDGADIRLTAAENLKAQLEAILEGEKGLDIFVRWKSPEEQPIGWNPDLNDGVRLNIRPFMLAKDVGKKSAGVLRVQPNIHWKKDRGTDVESAPWYKLGLQYGGNLGDRINDHHLTLAEKREARENKGL
ncbi:Eco57I restriction-modification methylase domain-containing protein [Enterobacter mori]|uniref:Eco57I restriction-modification methylase domain-containing protein n=1 Tax=Enterobacter mori TaxID=539813 RepID=UPI001B8CCEB2|nr:DNA methyltransferase [Enterobacter mori]MBS3049693.1 N-6 DNA methylase [Enterobacter mori]